jgi:large subunit ribosomal protein L21
MYAVARVAGHQFIAREGETVIVPRLKAEAGAKIKLEEILFLRSGKQAVVGQPTVPGALIEAEVVEHPRGPKLLTFKFRRREKYRRKQGHQQPLTKLRIAKIKYKKPAKPGEEE